MDIRKGLEHHLALKIGAVQSRKLQIATQRPKFPNPSKKCEENISNNFGIASTSSGPKNFISRTDADDLDEYFDSDEVVQEKIKILNECFQNSKNCVIYTGAGISTAAKIPDYRSKTGVWTLREQVILHIIITPFYADLIISKGIEVSPGADLLDLAQPTEAHHAVKSLVDRNKCTHVISTNVDGLHLRSGLDSSKLIELHGTKCHM